MKFFALIIGSEILNLRRQDKHFAFVSAQLKKRGFEFWGSNIIKDDPQLIVQNIKAVAKYKDSVLFCFGGIGSTPDDYTRKCAAQALGDGQLYEHEGAKKLILERFGDAAYPHRINMAMLPKGSQLLYNPINQIPGFSLQDRFFFTPGFPQMAHAMIEDALDRYYPNNQTLYRYNLKAATSENTLIEIMHQVSHDVEMSSLPKFEGDKRYVVISIASYEQQKAARNFALFERFLQERAIAYEVGEF